MTQLRGPEALAVLTRKQNIKVNLVESDTLAVLKAGNRIFTLPVYIQKNGEAAIESDFDFHKALTNTLITVNGEKATVLRFEKLPQSVALPAAPPEPTPQDIFNERMREAREANPRANELSLRLRVTEQLAREALTERQQSRTEQQASFGALPPKWASFAAASRRHANDVAARR